MCTVGSYLVIWITGDCNYYIAQVIQADPLELKVTETGPYSCLKKEDVAIHIKYSLQLHRDLCRNTNSVIEILNEGGFRVFTGLNSLGARGAIKETHKAPLLP